MPSDFLSYNRVEIESFLPSGWRLAEDQPEGAWDPQKRQWKATVIDGVDFEWDLVVKAAEASQQGRMAALQKAMEGVNCNRLGKGTRGLGLG
jgi:hypothetical protein